MPDDRLEREINEILDKIERFPGPESRRARARKRALRQVATSIADAQRRFARQLARVSMGQVMLLSLLIVMGAFFFGRFLGPARSWLLLAGVLLFVSSFAIMMFTGGARGQGGYWRGREISRRSSPLPARLRRWFARRRNRS